MALWLCDLCVFDVFKQISSRSEKANLDKFATFFMAIPGHSDFFFGGGVMCDGNFYRTTRNSTCSSGDCGADQFSLGVEWAWRDLLIFGEYPPVN